MGRPLLITAAIVMGVFALMTMAMPERMAQVGLTGALLLLGTTMLTAALFGRSLFVSRENGGMGPNSVREALRLVILWVGVIVVLVALYRTFPGIEQWWIARRS
jgi:hypothetical protein